MCCIIVPCQWRAKRSVWHMGHSSTAHRTQQTQSKTSSTIVLQTQIPPYCRICLNYDLSSTQFRAVTAEFCDELVSLHVWNYRFWSALPCRDPTYLGFNGAWRATHIQTMGKGRTTQQSRNMSKCFSHSSSPAVQRTLVTNKKTKFSRRTKGSIYVDWPFSSFARKRSICWDPYDARAVGRVA